jgi:transcriptional regulator with XRE-family HTH domain
MRMDPYMDMRAVAEAMGITPTEVSRMERGLDDPALLLAWHVAGRRASHA